MNSRMNALVLVVAVIMLSMSGTADGDLLNKLQNKVDDAAKVISNVCLLNDNCYKDFITLDNYCCLNKAQCCNIFDYIFSGGSAWDNFVNTFKNPRPINVILLIIAILIASLLLSMLLSIVGYFFCGCSRVCCCCGERKYTIVNH